MWCCLVLIQEGDFSVAIKGLLPQYSLDVPDKVTLGMCAVQDVLQGFFHIHNTRSALSA